MHGSCSQPPLLFDLHVAYVCMLVAYLRMHVCVICLNTIGVCVTGCVMFVFMHV